MEALLGALIALLTIATGVALAAGVVLGMRTRALQQQFALLRAAVEPRARQSAGAVSRIAAHARQLHTDFGRRLLLLARQLGDVQREFVHTRQLWTRRGP